MRRLKWIFLFQLVLSPLFSVEEEYTPPDEPFTSSLVKTQDLLSTMVDSVSTLSGEWVQSETDFILLGPDPLILNRSYSGDHFHNNKLGYNWDFNRPHKLIIEVEEKKRNHRKARARLQLSSGSATIHESLFRDKNLDGAIPLPLSRMKGLTNCRGEMSGKTNLHNTTLYFDWKEKHCASTTGSGLLTYYRFSHQQDLSTWKPAAIGIGHYKTRLLNHYVPTYEKRPSGNAIYFKDGVIQSSNGDGSANFGELVFRNEGVDTLVVEATDGKRAVYTFSIYDHLEPLVGQHLFLSKKRFTLTKAAFSHKPDETYEYTHRDSKADFRLCQSPGVERS